MTTILVQQDIDHLRSLQQKGLLVEMYDFLTQRGYRYATLASGVVQGNTFAGTAAIQFLDTTVTEQRETGLSAEKGSQRRKGVGVNNARDERVQEGGSDAVPRKPRNYRLSRQRFGTVGHESLTPTPFVGWTWKINLSPFRVSPFRE